MLTKNRDALLAVSRCSGGQNKRISIDPAMANRHGLITGATGTGKTVTLQTMAETFSAMGVPVFLADVKGDLSGMAVAGNPQGKLAARIENLGLAGLGYQPSAWPVCLWDVYGKFGHPVRVTASDVGPLILSRLLNLNETQSGVLELVFKVADDNGLLLLDFKDLRSMIQHVGENRDQYRQYGNVAAASIGAIQRSLLRLEEGGGDVFFGEPALDINDLLQTSPDGRGVINILSAEKLVNYPELYSCLLLWLLSELFERLPEQGDRDKPRLVFFFDEAHLLFDGASKILLQKIEQVTRLIRSRGVGIYFVSQNPADIPDSVLGQLGNRVQHALRAFTPKEQKALRAAAEAFRPNPAFSTRDAISELEVGEALVSLLDGAGRPEMVERALIVPPQGQIGPVGDDVRRSVLMNSLVAGVYEKTVDRLSAYEILQSRASMVCQDANGTAGSSKPTAVGKTTARKDANALDVNSLLGSLAKSAGRTISSAVGREIGRTIIRGVLGSLFGKR